MFTKISQSWALTKQSWKVLKADKHLLLFPILSGASILVAIVLTVAPALLIAGAAGVFDNVGNTGSKASPVEDPMVKVGIFATMFVLYFVTYTVATFFNVALMACAMARFNGEDSGAKAGLRLAVKRLPQIMMWSAVNATVGVILQALKERAGFIGRWVLTLVGVAWDIATFFVVPVLVVEGVGPITAIKRSAEVLKKTWGQSLVAQVGVSTVMSLVILAVLLLTIAASVGLGIVTNSIWVGVTIAGVGVLAMILIGLVASTLKLILVAACYRFASTGLIPIQFDGTTLREMFKQK